jgi:hypothetical protein
MIPRRSQASPAYGCTHQSKEFSAGGKCSRCVLEQSVCQLEAGISGSHEISTAELLSILGLVLPVFSIVKSELEVGWVVWCATSSVSRSKVEVLDLQIDGFIVPRIEGESLNVSTSGSMEQLYLVQILKPMVENALNRRCVAFSIREAWSVTGISSGHSSLDWTKSRSMSSLDMAFEWCRSPSAPNLFLMTSMMVSTSAESTGLPAHSCFDSL